MPPRRVAAEQHRRRSRGEMSYYAGLAAEDAIKRDYERRSYPLLRQRWRGRSGEIDLIFRDGDGFAFVEVKASWSFDQALEHLGKRQIRRLQKSAEEFVGTQPLGALSDMRFDVALMDRHGMIRVIENAFGP
ncbi:YraN family protein [Alloyangia pacifica]|uniref:YraN family protein n=1 Tax=Alloyangia pacifica TaxID=311180 RepID=UPI001CFD812F|nr:YraN family protein [Alloyangia pacifica]